MSSGLFPPPLARLIGSREESNCPPKVNRKHHAHSHRRVTSSLAEIRISPGKKGGNYEESDVFRLDFVRHEECEYSAKLIGNFNESDDGPVSCDVARGNDYSFISRNFKNWG